MAYTYSQVYLKTVAQVWPYFNFVEYDDELLIYDYYRPVNKSGQALSTSSGNVGSWSQLFIVDHTIAGIADQGGNSDYDLIVYDKSLWISQYNTSVAKTDARVLEWDGTSITQHLNAVSQDNYLAYSLTKWAGYLWCVTDISPGHADDRRVIYYYSRAAGWTAIADYGGVAYLTYNNNNEPTIRPPSTKLFVFRGGLYLVATRYDAVTAKWGWQVWQFNAVTWNSFTLLYETYDDYVLTNILLYGSQVLLFSNQVTAGGVAKNEAKFYSSYNMSTWAEDGTDASLGYVFGSAIFNMQIFLNCVDVNNDRTRVYIYSLATKTATLEEEITTHASITATGGLFVWESDLYLGKSMEIMRRAPREGAGTEDDESESDKIITLTKWTFKNAAGVTIDYRIAPIDVRGPDAFYEGRLLSMSGAERSTDDRTGLPAVGDMTIEIANHDKAISIILNSYPIWKNQVMQVWYAKRNKPEALKENEATMVVVDYYEKGPNYVVLLKDMNRKYFDISVPEEVAT